MSQSFIKKPDNGPHSALIGLGVLRSEQPTAAPAEWLLYEHDDGRHAVAPNTEAATFAHGDPAWHRVGPVEVLDQHAFHSRLRRALALIESEPDTVGLYSAACELRAVLGMHAPGVPPSDGSQS